MSIQDQTMSSRDGQNNVSVGQTKEETSAIRRRDDNDQQIVHKSKATRKWPPSQGLLLAGFVPLALLSSTNFLFELKQENKNQFCDCT